MTTPTGAPPSGLASGGDGTAWHALSTDSVLQAEQVDEREGLSSAEVQALAKVGAIMKRLQSTETLGSTSAINSDKTGTLTLNQMTAVQMALVDRRYAIEGRGYSSEGKIIRVAGQPEIPLDQFLLPMVLASDAVITFSLLSGRAGITPGRVTTFPDGAGQHGKTVSKQTGSRQRRARRHRS